MCSSLNYFGVTFNCNIPIQSYCVLTHMGNVYNVLTRTTSVNSVLNYTTSWYSFLTTRLVCTVFWPTRLVCTVFWPTRLVCTVIWPTSRGFNGSVNIQDICDFRSQFDPLNIIFYPFFLLLLFLLFCRHFEWKSIE